MGLLTWSLTELSQMAMAPKSDLGAIAICFWQEGRRKALLFTALGAYPLFVRYKVNTLCCSCPVRLLHLWIVAGGGLWS